jgi:hypothetical protein
MKKEELDAHVVRIDQEPAGEEGMHSDGTVLLEGRTEDQAEGALSHEEGFRSDFIDNYVRYADVYELL